MDIWTKRAGLLAATMLAGAGAAGQANASLSLFNSFTGNEAVSTDGCGSTTQSCTLQSLVPTGSTIQAAYLYSSMFGQPGSGNPSGTTLNLGASSVAPTFTALGTNAVAGLQAYRADVTSFVQNNITLGSTTTWTAKETNGSQDGEALVVVWSNPTVQPTTHTISVLDGFSSSTGDTSHVSFTALPAGFTAQMMIGDGFSFDGPDPHNPTNSNQVSTITVNGATLTDVAGHCDDAQDAECADGNLITVGGNNAGSKDDPFTPFPNPLVGQDHEHYDLGNIFNVGDTSATLHTVNPSDDDNIFLEVFDISGTASFATPEPGSLAILGAALAGFGVIRRRKRARS